jgi:hypothetical protein
LGRATASFLGHIALTFNPDRQRSDSPVPA